MPYFKRIERYDTYEGHEASFHFDYNANSGGGQSFLGGYYRDDSGNLQTGKGIEGKTALFCYKYRDSEGLEHTVDLGSDPLARLSVTPRGEGNQNMKLSVEGKVRPSLLIPALLMLPRTCGRNMADSLDRSPLTLDNYWLRSMWLDVEVVDNNNVRLIPKDFVFEGGSSKKKGVSDDKTVRGRSEFFLLDYEQRSRDIIRLADFASIFPEDIASAISFFKRVLLDEEAFSYKVCDETIELLMTLTARLWPEQYSGISDPLPALMQIASCPSGTLQDTADLKPICKFHNLIFFGAPGTGKSYELNKNAEKSFPEDNVSRVTFYPDYTYSQFVGCFKPMTEDALDGSGRTEITYRYVPGPFLETYINAVLHPEQKYLLIVEEINRANPAAVFGDVFQLLDRRADGRSDYTIAVPVEMRQVLAKEGIPTDKLAIPSNMYIWATMNSADQGVFPMDTAFKRRWDFKYMKIDEGENAVIDGKLLKDIVVPCGKRSVRWNDLRKAINDFMTSDDLKINEDKLLGPFFVAPDALTPERFPDAFKDKVLLYLYEDAGKPHRKKMFRKELKKYEDICTAFDEQGEGIFGNGFKDDLVFSYDEEQAKEADNAQG